MRLPSHISGRYSEIKSTLSIILERNTLSYLTHHQSPYFYRFQLFRSICLGYGSQKAYMDQKGVLTIEAALVLPLFLSAMFFIACMMNITWLNLKIGSALTNVCNEMSSFAYPVSAVGGSQSEEAEDGEGTVLNGEMFSHLYLSVKMGNLLGADSLVKEMVQGGTAGIRYLNSSMMEDGQIIDIIAEYDVELPFSEFGVPPLHCMQRARMHGWVGYLKEKNQDDSRNDPVVFVTDTGTVYHRSRDCAYISLSVAAVNGADVRNIRSEDGSIYYPCELCRAPAVLSAADTVFLTTDGNRYHTSKECSGIKRSVHEILLSEAGGRRPCSKCGGQ